MTAISTLMNWNAANSSTSDRSAGIDHWEAALIRRAQQGDQPAFTQLMNLYRERIMRLTQHMVGNSEDAHDLCQETFVRVYRALSSFDTGRPFSPWIYRIAHNVITDFFRNRKTKPAIMDSVEDYTLEDRVDRTAVDPQGALISKETKKRVQAAIQSLPESYRSVVVSRFVDNLSYAEIAEALNLTEANVMMRMSRARRLLRDKL